MLRSLFFDDIKVELTRGRPSLRVIVSELPNSSHRVRRQPRRQDDLIEALIAK